MTNLHEVYPGKVPASGSVWRLYFPTGATPSEYEVRVALGALGAVKVSLIGDPVGVTFDASATPGVVTIFDKRRKEVHNTERERVVEAVQAGKDAEGLILAAAERIAAERTAPLEQELSTVKDSLLVAEQSIAELGSLVNEVTDIIEAPIEPVPAIKVIDDYVPPMVVEPVEWLEPAEEIVIDRPIELTEEVVLDIVEEVPLEVAEVNKEENK